MATTVAKHFQSIQHLDAKYPGKTEETLGLVRQFFYDEFKKKSEEQPGLTQAWEILRSYSDIAILNFKATPADAPTTVERRVYVRCVSSGKK